MGLHFTTVERCFLEPSPHNCHFLQIDLLATIESAIIDLAINAAVASHVRTPEDLGDVAQFERGLLQRIELDLDTCLLELILLILPPCNSKKEMNRASLLCPPGAERGTQSSQLSAAFNKPLASPRDFITRCEMSEERVVEQIEGYFNGIVLTEGPIRGTQCERLKQRHSNAKSRPSS